MTDEDNAAEVLSEEEIDERFHDLCDKLLGVGEAMLAEIKVPRAYLGRALVKAGLYNLRKGKDDAFATEYMHQIVEGMRASRSVN